MDVLAPRIGEIIAGSQREARLEVLDQTMAERGIDNEYYVSSLTLPRWRGRERWGASSASSPMSPTSPTSAMPFPSRARRGMHGIEN